nr:mif4g type,initiation factor eif gamma ma3,Armadillo type fold [Hymenolepis microstoma]
MAYPVIQQQMSRMPHPQNSVVNYGPFMGQQIPQRASSVQPVSTKGKTLEILDPNTRQKVDLENINLRKAQTPETESTPAATVSVPITIKTPPPTLSEGESKHEVIEQELESPHQSVGFTIDSDGDEGASRDATENVDEDDKSSSRVSPSPLQEVSEASAGSEFVNSQKEQSDTESQNEDADNMPPPSPPNGSQMTESFSTGNIQKYNREQLISIRSATDFTAMPMIPLSSAANIGTNQAKSRGGRKPISNAGQKRILNFNTNVKLDEVNNAYVPSQFAKHDKKEEDVENKEELRKNIMFTLNHATGAGVGYCVEEIKKLNIKSEENVDILVGILVNKCRDRNFREPYAKLIKALMELKIVGFGEKLLKRFHDQVSTPIANYIKDCNAGIDKKIAESKDDKVKKMFEEDRESTLVKSRDQFLSIVEFYSYLSAIEVVPFRTYLDAIRNFSKPKSQDEVTELIACLKITGELLEKKNNSFLKNCMNALDNCAKTMKIESHVRFSIDDLKELRAKGWKKQEPVKHQSGPSQSQQQNTYGRRISATSRPPMQQQQQQSSNRVNDARTTIDATNLTMSGSGSRPNFLGPTRIWSQGSNAHRRSNAPETISRTGSNTNRQRAQASVGAPVTSQSTANAGSTQIDERLTASSARRDFIDAFTNSDNPDIDLQLKEELKPEFVQSCLCKAIESKASERAMFVNILTYICSKNQLTFEQLAKGFEDSIQFGLEQDLPKVGEYFGELMSAAITPKFMNFSKLAEEFNKLEEDSYKREALARCAKVASERIGEQEVAKELEKTLAAGLPWGDDQSFKKPDFLKRYRLEFITNVAPAPASVAPTTSNPAPINAWRDAKPNSQRAAGDPAVFDQIDDCLLNKDYANLASLCSQYSKSKGSEKYLKHILVKCRGAQSKVIESLLPVVKVFIEHENEKRFLSSLQSAVDKNNLSLWHQALLQNKLISSEALNPHVNRKPL